MSLVKDMEKLQKLDAGIGEKAFMGDAVAFARVVRSIENKDVAFAFSVLSYKMKQDMEEMKEDLKKALHEEMEEHIKA